VLLSRDARSTSCSASSPPRASGQRGDRRGQRIKHDLSGVPGVTVGGSQLTFSQLDDAIAAQLPQVELIAFSILLLLSLIAFRGLVAARCR
jgi:hypothetical protein